MGESQCSIRSTQPAGNSEPVDEDGCDTFQFHGKYWGRLYPALHSVLPHDLTRDETVVGKQTSCNICIKSDEVPNDFWIVMSRRQFSIIRTQVEKFGKISTEIKLKDLSMNGTYINGSLVGKGRARTLLDNSVIALGKPLNNVYFFKDASVINKKHPSAIVNKYDASVGLGSGAYGEVTLMFCKKSGKGYAMKSILKGNSTNKKKLETELQKLENEVNILKKIKHPNVIQLIDAVTYGSQKYLFLELMLGKDLYSRIFDHKRLTESQAKLYFYQIVSGVQYLHQNEIIHRDLKPENVLLATFDVETLVKITDFGLSKVLHEGTYLRSLCGTKLYVAPEVLVSGGSQKYTGLVDVWSMGVILYVCLSGITPFSRDMRHGKTMDQQIITGDYTMPPSSWECVTDPAKHIVKKMMTLDVKKRITISEILRDPWLQDSALMAAIQRLVPTTEMSEDSKKMFKLAAQGKENDPTIIDKDCDYISSSPVTAELKSPPFSPRLKRRRRY